MMRIRDRMGHAAPKPTPSSFVSIPVQPVAKVSAGSIFSLGEGASANKVLDQSLDDMLWWSVQKHFQKQTPAKAHAKVVNTTNTTLSEQSSLVMADQPNKLENVLNY